MAEEAAAAPEAPASAPPEPQLDPAGEMSFMEHLGVLRGHVLRSLLWFSIGLVVGFAFVDRAWDALMMPLCDVKPDDCHVYPREMMESLWVYLKLGALLAFFVTLPALFAEAWAFIAPGLYQHEKKIALPFSLAVGVLFAGGATFGFFVVLPPAMKFFFGLPGLWSFHYLISMQKYFSFCATLLIAFGAIFELPLVMMLFSMAGLVSPRWFMRYRRVMYFAMFVFSAVVTPTTDPVTMMLMGGPMIVLYEVGILLGRMVYRSRSSGESPGPPAPT